MNAKELHEAMKNNYETALDVFYSRENNNELATAIEYCNSAIDLYEKNVDTDSQLVFSYYQKTLNLLGHIYFAIDQCEDALECVRRFYQLKKNSATPIDTI